MVCSWVIGTALLGVPLASLADVYKRIGQDGQVIFTDKPQGHGFALVTKANAPVRAEVSNTDLEKRSIPAPRPVPPASMVHRLPMGQVILGNGPRIFSFRPSAQGGGRPSGADMRGADFANLIDRAAFVHGLDPWLLHAVIRAESAYNPGARSSKGAMGLMQLMPDTAARYGVRDPWNPEENVHAGARYLKDLMGMFGADIRLAVAAYNAGEGNVQKYGNQIPPFEETRDYVSKVLGFYGR